MENFSSSSICGLARVNWDDRYGAQSCSAIVFEQAGYTLKLSTTSALPNFARVRLTFGGLEYRASIESVATVEQGFEAALALQESRRIDERLPRTGKLQLLLGDNETPVDVAATNYSRGGLQVSSAQPLAVEEPLQFWEEGVRYYGITRYCRTASSGYLIGIQLVDDPEH